MRLYFCGIPPSWDRYSLMDLVCVYGKVNYCEVRTEAHDQGEKYGVVHFGLSCDAQEAKIRLNGSTVKGYKLKVSDSPPVQKY